MELPEDGKSGFDFPAGKMEGVARELWEGLKVTAKYALAEPLGEDDAWARELNFANEGDEEEKGRGAKDKSARKDATRKIVRT